MKISLSTPKRYILQYILFCFLFLITVVLLIFLSYRLMQRPKESTVSLPKGSAPVVVIDAGHGGEDGGAVGANGIYEKDLNLQIAQMLNDLLRANGIQTVMTRTEDILLYDRNSDYRGQKKIQDLATRRKIAEEQANAVFISIHMNAFPQAQYSGLQVYYSPNAPQSKELANKIQSITKELLLPQNRRSVKAADGTIYLLDRLQCPAVLVECGFLSNPEECARLSTEEYRRQMALSLYLSIVQYFSDSDVNSQTAP